MQSEDQKNSLLLNSAVMFHLLCPQTFLIRQYRPWFKSWHVPGLNRHYVKIILRNCFRKKCFDEKRTELLQRVLFLILLGHL